MTNRILFARKCSATGEGMNEGWVANDCDYYFKYKEDALAHAKEMGYADLYDAHQNGELYFTEWGDQEDYEWELVNGELVEL